MGQQRTRRTFMKDCSTSAAACNLLTTDEGSLRVTRTAAMMTRAGHRRGGKGSPSCPSCPSMSVRHAVPAVIAADGGLDQTGAVGVAAAKKRQQSMARM